MICLIKLKTGVGAMCCVSKEEDKFDYLTPLFQDNLLSSMNVYLYRQIIYFLHIDV